MDPQSTVLTADGFTAVYDEHVRTLYRYCARRVCPEAAEDVVSQTFLIAFERRDRYDPRRAPILPWLLGIATKQLQRHRRDEVRGYRALARTGRDPVLGAQVVESHAHRVDERATANQQARRIAKVLANLPRRQRDVLLLSALGELQYAEIAQALELPVGTVQSALHRARVKLRAALVEADDGA